MQTEIFLIFAISTIVFLDQYRIFHYNFKNKHKTFSDYLRSETSFIMESWLVLYRAMVIIFIFVWIFSKFLDFLEYLYKILNTPIS